MIQLGDSGCAGLETGFVKIASLGPAVCPANVCKHEEGEMCWPSEEELDLHEKSETTFISASSGYSLPQPRNDENQVEAKVLELNKEG